MHDTIIRPVMFTFPAMPILILWSFSQSRHWDVSAGEVMFMKRIQNTYKEILASTFFADIPDSSSPTTLPSITEGCEERADRVWWNMTRDSRCRCTLSRLSDSRNLQIEKLRGPPQLDEVDRRQKWFPNTGRAREQISISDIRIVATFWENYYFYDQFFDAAWCWKDPLGNLIIFDERMNIKLEQGYHTLRKSGQDASILPILGNCQQR